MEGFRRAAGARWEVRGRDRRPAHRRPEQDYEARRTPRRGARISVHRAGPLSPARRHRRRPRSTPTLDHRDSPHRRRQPVGVACRHRHAGDARLAAQRLRDAAGAPRHHRFRRRRRRGHAPRRRVRRRHQGLRLHPGRRLHQAGRPRLTPPPARRTFGGAYFAFAGNDDIIPSSASGKRSRDARRVRVAACLRGASRRASRLLLRGPSCLRDRDAAEADWDSVRRLFAQHLSPATTQE